MGFWLAIKQIFTGQFGTRTETGAEEQSRSAHERHRRSKSPGVGAIRGKLTHRTIYTFGATQSGQSHTKCPICGDPRVHVFSNCVDEVAQNFRCCLRCLDRFGGRTQVDLAAKRSRYAMRVVECMDALDQLRREFPDPERRPAGEKSLQMEIELPFMGYQGIERVLKKIRDRSWTEFDLKKIAGE